MIRLRAKRIVKGIVARLSASFEGLSPESAALALAVGVILGTFPVYGLPTLLCTAVSLALGLNLPAVQVVNQLATPLQLAMLLPFIKIGARLLGPAHPTSLGLGSLAMQAVAGWAMVCVPLGAVMYFTLPWMVRGLASAHQLFQRPSPRTAG